jgi:hypothetical protein
VNTKHQDKDFTWRPSCNWNVCYTTVLKTFMTNRVIKLSKY